MGTFGQKTWIILSAENGLYHTLWEKNSIYHPAQDVIITQKHIGMSLAKVLPEATSKVLVNKYYLYLYSGAFLKPNIIRTWVICSNKYYSYSYSGNFSNPILFIFSQTEYRWDFPPNRLHTLLSIDTYNEPKNVEDAKISAKSERKDIP